MVSANSIYKKGSPPRLWRSARRVGRAAPLAGVANFASPGNGVRARGNQVRDAQGSRAELGSLYLKAKPSIRALVGYCAFGEYAERGLFRPGISP